MQIKLSEVVARINKKLNLTSFTYSDIDVFFDQAIAELNTMLHVGLRPISECVELQAKAYYNVPNIIRLTAKPTETALPTSSSGGTAKFYYDVDTKKYNVLTDGAYVEYDTLFGLYIDYTTNVATYYQAWLNDGSVYWYPDEHDNPTNLSVSDYLTMEWITLFLIPYVCASIAARDGGSTTLFQDEFANGFTQLRASWNIPQYVLLNDMAGDPAYTEDVAAMLYNPLFAQLLCPTRAIKANMRLTDGLTASYYFTDGWK